jgi:branched-subunit amino acid aminotransferase/4-amino-4-deoxychorismate lyase
MICINFLITGIQGKIYQLEEHINRFYSSCEKIGLSLTYSKDEIKRVCSELVEKNKEHNAIIYYQVEQDPCCCFSKSILFEQFFEYFSFH